MPRGKSILMPLGPIWGGGANTKVRSLYLGQVMSFSDKMEKEFKERTRKAWEGFWALNQVFKSEMSILSKIKSDKCRISNQKI